MPELETLSEESGHLELQLRETEDCLSAVECGGCSRLAQRVGCLLARGEKEVSR